LVRYRNLRLRYAERRFSLTTTPRVAMEDELVTEEVTAGKA